MVQSFDLAVDEGFEDVVHSFLSFRVCVPSGVDVDFHVFSFFVAEVTHGEAPVFVQVNGECPPAFLVGELISVCGQFSVCHGVFLSVELARVFGVVPQSAYVAECTGAGFFFFCLAVAVFAGSHGGLLTEDDEVNDGHE